MAKESSESDSLMDQLGLDKLKSSLGEYVSGWGENLVQRGVDKLNGVAEQASNGGGAAGEAAKEGAEELAEGESPAKAALSAATTGVKEKAKDVFGGGGGSGGSGKMRFANFVETIDVGMPLSVVYNAWTTYDSWPDFMKKAEQAKFNEDEGTAEMKGQVFWSHRSWEATIVQQVPDDHIVWRSTGEKGHLDGAVSFHPLGERLTRMVIVVEYHPQGFFEKTGNIWRAVGRRLRLELKHFVRHVMTEVILDPDSVEGWRGEIRDEEIVRTHDEVVEEEQAEEEQAEEGPEDSAEEDAPDDEVPAEDEAEGEPVEEDEDEPEDEGEAVEEEPVEDEPVEEDEDEPEDEGESSEEEEQSEERPRTRRKARSR
ncbi:SRPBCC family protein [Pseudactinotalea sp. Z1748]|uniref:SRPBCC family protein n=1 Tax=Pseudactinotalea sp. Z1748 TaxID=3413027 RepID=UPI003C7BF190